MNVESIFGILTTQGISLEQTSPTSSYACDSRTDSYGNVIPDCIVFTNFGTASQTVTLPSPTLPRLIVVCSIDGSLDHVPEILPHSAEKINGSSSPFTFAHSPESVVLHSDGANWWILAQYYSAGA